MWARLPRAEFVRGVGEGNRRAFRRIVRRGERPGILAYVNGEPAAWVALAPREAYRRLEASRVLRPVDDRPVWSVACFFVAKTHRRMGLSVRMLREAARFAAARGARILEGYPVDTRGRGSPDAFVWTGLAPAFLAAGFTEVTRRSASRPIMRKALRRASTPRRRPRG
jgi:GNAT superfamily N-acetyltransferase